jgi:hypothetical protein
VPNKEVKSSYPIVENKEMKKDNFSGFESEFLRTSEFSPIKESKSS